MGCINYSMGVAKEWKSFFFLFFKIIRLDLILHPSIFFIVSFLSFPRHFHLPCLGLTCGRESDLFTIVLVANKAQVKSINFTCWFISTDTISILERLL